MNNDLPFDSEPDKSGDDIASLHIEIRGLIGDFAPRSITLAHVDAMAASIVSQILTGAVITITSG